MSRLYIRAKGSRSMLTRTAVDQAIAEILYNFDGKGHDVGYVRLEAEASVDRSKYVYTLTFVDERSGREQRLGTWEVTKADPREIKAVLKADKLQPKLF